MQRDIKDSDDEDDIDSETTTANIMSYVLVQTVALKGTQTQIKTSMTRYKNIENVML